jgi:hypothetical protein
MTPGDCPHQGQSEPPYLQGSVAEPKLIVSAPAPAPTFEKFWFWSRSWLQPQLGRHLFAQLFN